MHLVLKESAMQYLTRKGYDPIFGARPIKRAIQRDLETPLAQALLRNEFEVCVPGGGGGVALKMAGTRRQRRWCWRIHSHRHRQ